MQSDQLPVVALDAANEPTQMIDDGIVSSALRGHVLGNIPDEAVRESHIEGGGGGGGDDGGCGGRGRGGDRTVVVTMMTMTTMR